MYLFKKLVFLIEWPRRRKGKKNARNNVLSRLSSFNTISNSNIKFVKKSQLTLKNKKKVILVTLFLLIKFNLKYIFFW